MREIHGQRFGATVAAAEEYCDKRAPTLHAHDTAVTRQHAFQNLSVV